MDKVMRPRLTQFVTAPWTYVVASIARDGVVALVAMALAVLTGGIVAYALIGSRRASSEANRAWCTREPR